MGSFLENRIELVQLVKGDIVDGKIIDSSSGIYQILHDLNYSDERQRVRICVPAGYVTDGYSKPWWSKMLVGGRYEDDLRPAVLHDYLCQNKGFYYSGKHIPLSFSRVNNLFLQAMQDVGLSSWRQTVYRIAVDFNKNRW